MASLIDRKESMKKRILALFTASLLALSVTACGGSGIAKEDYDAAIIENAKLKEELEKQNEEFVSKTDYEALAAENEELKKQIEDLQSQINSTSSYEEAESEEIPSAAEEDIEPMHVSLENPYPVVYDKNGIKVSINSFGYANSKTVYKMVFLIENDSKDEVIATLSDVEINDFEISTSASLNNVSAGKKGTTDSSIWQRDLDEVKITEWSSFSGNIKISNGLFTDAIDIIPVIVDKECWTLAE